MKQNESVFLKERKARASKGSHFQNWLDLFDTDSLELKADYPATKEHTNAYEVEHLIIKKIEMVFFTCERRTTQTWLHVVHDSIGHTHATRQWSQPCHRELTRGDTDRNGSVPHSPARLLALWPIVIRGPHLILSTLHQRKLFCVENPTASSLSGWRGTEICEDWQQCKFSKWTMGGYGLRHLDTSPTTSNTMRCGRLFTDEIMCSQLSL